MRVAEAVAAVTVQGTDHTLFALVDGNVKFHTNKYPWKRIVSVLPKAAADMQ